MPMHCEKFLLDKKKKPHFFSGIDGNLHQLNERQFYPNDKYCVDFFYFKNQLDPEVDDIKVAVSLTQ